ncbi:MAG: LysR family transcriptional regulator [Pseudobacteriovorax sp.]|nr:LysR family transcriptional regulator [Pseudobacteriovorax sp.]
MDMNRLKYFCTVARVGSITKAASLLGLSQPALSKSIKILEHECGRKLISPSGRGITITKDGIDLALKAEPLFQQLSQLQSNKENETHLPSYTIVTYELFSTYLMGTIISSNLAGYQLDIIENLPGQIEDKIHEGTANYGITAHPVPKRGIEYLKLASIPMKVFGRREMFASDSFEKLPFVVPIYPIEVGSINRIGLDGWSDYRSHRNIKYRVSLMETALEFCRLGLCVGYFPEFTITLHNQRVLPQFHLEPIDIDKKVSQKRLDVYSVISSMREKHPVTLELNAFVKTLLLK